jgi:hypothetical protein
MEIKWNPFPGQTGQTSTGLGITAKGIMKSSITKENLHSQWGGLLWWMWYGNNDTWTSGSVVFKPFSWETISISCKTDDKTFYMRYDWNMRFLVIKYWTIIAFFNCNTRYENGMVQTLGTTNISTSIWINALFSPLPRSVREIMRMTPIAFEPTDYYATPIKTRMTQR